MLFYQKGHKNDPVDSKVIWSQVGHLYCRSSWDCLSSHLLNGQFFGTTTHWKILVLFWFFVALPSTGRFEHLIVLQNDLFITLLLTPCKQKIVDYVLRNQRLNGLKKCDFSRLNTLCTPLVWMRIAAVATLCTPSGYFIGMLQ